MCFLKEWTEEFCVCVPVQSSASQTHGLRVSGVVSEREPSAGETWPQQKRRTQQSHIHTWYMNINRGNLTYHNHWASIVLQRQTMQCSVIQQHRIAFYKLLLLMNRNVHFFFLMHYKPHDVKTISWITKSKFTGFCFYIGDIKWHSY